MLRHARVCVSTMFHICLFQNINESVDEGLRLAPHSLLESVPNLGLIVDLTNTNRYYNPQVNMP